MAVPFFQPGENTLYHADELLYITNGSYSSYGVSMLARVRKDFDARAYVREPEAGAFYSRVDTARLLADGLIEELEARELWTGES